MRYRLDTLKNVRKFYSKLINDYFNQSQTDEISEVGLTDTKFKNLCAGLNGLSKVLADSELEARIEALEQMNE